MNFVNSIIMWRLKIKRLIFQNDTPQQFLSFSTKKLKLKKKCFYDTEKFVDLPKF